MTLSITRPTQADPSALLFEDSEKFQEHLNTRSEGIKTAIQDLFTKIPAASPDVVKLQEIVGGRR